MNPFKKVTAVLLAVLMIVLAAGCTPISLSKEWSYKYGDQELPIGVYIYSMYQAYNEAKSYAEKLDDYATDKSFLDLEITDDDGNTQVAREWILDKADKITRNVIAINSEIENNNVTVDQATLDEAEKTAKNTWDMGQYVSYGYFSPMSKELEPYGISYESFYISTYEAMAKQSCLFNALYGKGGAKEVTDAELTEYFNSNYTDYKYFAANLYTSETGEDGTSTNVALSDEDKEKVKAELDKYAEEVNSGKSFDDVVKEYMDNNSITEDPTKTGTEVLDKSSIGDELKEKLGEMAEGTCATVAVGDGDSAQYYLIYKGKIADAADGYISDDTNRTSVLSAMKSEDFNSYLEDLATNLDVEINTSQTNRYKPDMFFVPVAPSTAATTSASES
ncbi:MAG: hypothetical protein PUB41_00095 [bacterium]|nr:hypothetical protein [bacterium]MDD6224653.1 hypothetical protein [bacterium]